MPKLSKERQLVKFTIVEFKNEYQQAVENLVLPIQQDEFSIRITREEQIDLVDIKGIFQKGKGNFWVALANGTVVGAIGIMDIGHSQVALKKMFVHKNYRGQKLGLASALMNKAKEWCNQKAIKQIYLGTTTQMTAAHKFYEKNNFVPVDTPELPTTFPIVSVDSKFYRCNLVPCDLG